MKHLIIIVALLALCGCSFKFAFIINSGRIEADPTFTRENTTENQSPNVDISGQLIPKK